MLPARFGGVKHDLRRRPETEGNGVKKGDNSAGAEFANEQKCHQRRAGTIEELKPEVDDAALGDHSHRADISDSAHAGGKDRHDDPR